VKSLAEKRFKGPFRHLYDFSLRKLTEGIVTYQPVPEISLRLKAGRRDCEERWRLVADRLGGETISSVIDLGCAEGYFVRAAARLFACPCLGVEGDPRRFLIAANASVKSREIQTGYMFSEISSSLVAKLPTYDLVISMSLMHHVFYQQGAEEAERLIRAMHGICGRFLVFDMGHSGEKTYQWASLLPDMGERPAEWIADFLAKAGFVGIETLGVIASPKNPAGRTLFLARPA
jgi:SAM-dependent methyltransferase